MLKFPFLVSTAVRNNIKPIALASTVQAVIKARGGTPRKVNLDSTQSYKYRIGTNKMIEKII